MTVFRTLYGVPLDRAEWHTVVTAGRNAFDTALGDDYGNLMEWRLVLDEMTAGGDEGAAADLTALDARVTAAEAARDAAEAATAAGIAARR